MKNTSSVHTSSLKFLLVILGTSVDGTGVGNGILLFTSVSFSFSFSSFVFEDLVVLLSSSELLLLFPFFEPIKSKKYYNYKSTGKVICQEVLQINIINIWVYTVCPYLSVPICSITMILSETLQLADSACEQKIYQPSSLVVNSFDQTDSVKQAFPVCISNEVPFCVA